MYLLSRKWLSTRGRAYKLSRQVFLNSDSFIRRNFKNLELEKVFLEVLLRKDIIIVPNKSFFYGSHSLSLIAKCCVLTNRFRGVKTKLKLSRHSIRNLGIRGQLVGLKKRSW